MNRTPIARLAALCTLVLLLALGGAKAHAWSGGTNISVQNGTIAITGQVAVGNGGTGAGSFTANGVLMGNGTSAFQVSAAGTSGQPFLSGGAGAAGAYGNLDISTSAVTGVLPIARGGTNAGSLTSNRCLRFDGTSIVAASGDCSTPQTPLIALASGMDLTTSQTVYLGLSGAIDTTEAQVQVPLKNGATLASLQCNNGAVQGVGNNIVITGRVGSCGSLSDSGTFTCTITGSASANQSCNGGSNTMAVTAGQCVSVKVVTPAALSANARVACSIERTA